MGIDPFVLVGFLLAAKQAAAAAVATGTLLDYIEAAAVGQVASGLNGGRIITGTSGSGRSVSFALPGSSREIGPTDVLRIYVGLRRLCQAAASGLALNPKDSANNDAIAEAVENELMDGEPADPDFSNYRGLR